MGTTINDTPETTVSGLLRVTFRNGAPVRLLADGMSRDEFYDFCLANPELRIERTADNQLIIMPPTGSETGNRNSEIHLEIGIWNRKTKLGYTFDSSTGFTLPNGAERAPDTAWIQKDRWEALSAEEKKRFAPIVPDFVLELRSEGQNMGELREKMGEYMGAGCRLGWLIDPSLQCTYVYDEHGSVQNVPFSETLDGGEVMPGLLVRWAEVLG